VGGEAGHRRGHHDQAAGELLQALTSAEVDAGIVAVVDRVLDVPVAQERAAQVHGDRQREAEIGGRQRDVEGVGQLADRARARRHARAGAEIDGGRADRHGGTGAEVSEDIGARGRRGGGCQDGGDDDEGGFHRPFRVAWSGGVTWQGAATDEARSRRAPRSERARSA
jgi:hypothetical protein